MAGIYFFSKSQSQHRPQSVARVSHSHTIFVIQSFLIRLAVSGSPFLQREDDTFLSLCLLRVVASCDQLFVCAVVGVGCPVAAHHHGPGRQALDEPMGRRLGIADVTSTVTAASSSDKAAIRWGRRAFSPFALGRPTGKATARGGRNPAGLRDSESV